jgi:SAM-dependent methyltransferase
VGVHLLAVAATLLLALSLHRLGHATSGLGLLLVEGLAAGALSRWLALPAWWQLINLLFFPAAGLMLLANVPAGWYLAGFLILVATSLGAVVSRVPLYLSSAQAMAAVAARLPQGRPLRLIDLGCGTGGLLGHLARIRPDVRLHGVDAAPLPWLVSRLRLGRSARIRLGSLWDEDLATYDVVYAYLSPAPMARLWDKVQREMRPGSLFISNTFTVPGRVPDETVELHDLSRGRLLLWRMP